MLMCADLDEERLKKIKELYPQIQTTKNYKEILENPKIDAVCVSSPTDTHYDITKEALEQDKHVLCEKPLALTAKECENLKKLADKKKKILMVGHVFVFNAGINWIKDYIDSGELGKVHYAYATRTNLGPFRYDVNAMWDLAPHDISIFNYLFGSSPCNVSARGQKSLGTNLEDLAFATLEYPENIIANVHVSWLDPKKVRQITIVGNKKMLVWDDLDNEGPVKIFDKHVEKTATFYATYNEFQLLWRDGSITIPKIGSNEPLQVQGQYFLECIQNNRHPDLVDAEKAIGVVKTLVSIQKSIDAKGKCISLSRRKTPCP